jgi:hypothetical protein
MKDDAVAFEQFISFLEGMKMSLTGRELTETLWLAQRIKPLPAKPKTPLNPPSLERPPHLNPPPPEGPPPPFIPPPPSDSREPPRADVYVGGKGSGVAPAGVSFRLPGVVALPRSLSISRSLRPLMKRVPSRSETIIDEVATAEQSADLGIITPVLRAAPERWLDLAIVVERSGAMRMWSRSIADLKALLERLGAFRNVRSWDVILEAADPSRLMIRSAASCDQRVRSPNELIDPAGRRLIALVSDCVSPFWLDGRMKELLGRWSQSGPVVVLQILPPNLWDRSGLRATPALSLRSVSAGSPNSALVRGPWRKGARVDHSDGVVVPVVPIEAGALHEWARVVAASGNAVTHGVLLRTVSDEAPDQRAGRASDPVKSSPALRVNRFDAVSGPNARRLARLFAATPYDLTLPVMRLIQQTIMPESDLTDAAEVYLGGLLRKVADRLDDDDPEQVPYDFIEGVREVLLDAAGRDDSADVMSTVSRFVTAHLGQAVDFGAILADPSLASSMVVPNDQQPIVQLGAMILRRMGGHYARIADSLERRHVQPGRGDLQSLFRAWNALDHPRRRRLTLAAYLGNDVAQRVLGRDAPVVPKGMQEWSAGLRSWGLPVVITAAIEAAAIIAKSEPETSMIATARQCLAERTSLPAQSMPRSERTSDPIALALAAAAKPFSSDEPAGRETTALAVAAILGAAESAGADRISGAIRDALMRALLDEGTSIAEASPRGTDVWVLGTGSFTLPEVVQWTSSELGRMLARNGHHLLIGAWPGVDHMVSRAYAAELELLGHDVPERLTQFIMPSMTPSFRGGKIEETPTGDAPAGRARVVITVGGYDVVLQRAHNLPANVCLLPLRWTGASSSRLWSERPNSDSRFLDWPVLSKEDLGIPMRRLATVLARESSRERRETWTRYEELMVRVMDSSAPEKFVLAELPDFLPGMAARVVDDYVRLSAGASGGTDLVRSIGQVIASHARDEAYDVLTALVRAQIAIATATAAPDLVTAAEQLFSTREELEAWFIRFVGISLDEVRFRWSVDERVRTLARSYLQRQPLTASERYASELRKRLQTKHPRRASWVIPYLASEEASLRVIGFVLIFSRPSLGSAVDLPGLLTRELQHSLKSGETRPLWQLLVAFAASLAGLPASDRRIGERAFRSALALLESSKSLDPGGQCKSFLQKCLAGELEKEASENRRLNDSATAYERLRSNNVPGPRRTAAMHRVVNEIIKYAQALSVTAAEVAVIGRINTDGHRILAIALASALKDRACLAIALEGIGNPRSPFEQYVALELADALLMQLEAAELRSLTETIQRQRSPGGLINDTDPSRWILSGRMLERIARLVIRMQEKRRTVIGIFGSDPSRARLRPLCEHLGRVLAESEFSVIVGGGNVGEWIASSFAEHSSHTDRLRTIRRATQKPSEYGSPITTPATLGEYREAFVGYLDAAIALGGKEGTAEECELALRHRLPLIVIPSTGGVSTVYQPQSLQNLIVRGVHPSTVEKLNGKLNAEALTGAVMEVLGVLFPREQQEA